ncbi:FKBP-type peptidyl-prolyl cis-trans isomerase SlyD [Thiohalophilus thiocyanatoxydans]|uniref:peptidylprolyl isomerase n=2 Tax=Thiohalophilus thiocyanatoxydans TaxID=381308 RepID=A0A4R8IQE5_9GAMM|nr:FKBP-type peptidyl-prolyl cis-trans isomerase SlyD [Thiohalophilus thiocyanatoxydans]
MNQQMEDVIGDNKYVELMYKVIDKDTGSVLTKIEYPLGYVHGVNEVLAPAVTAELEGKLAGDVIEVPIDCNELYGPRDDSLVIVEPIENVPEEYREVGTSILMENDKGQTKTFLVTRVDEKSVTIDGNNPLSGREVIFKLEIRDVRDATEEEMEFGGMAESVPDVEGATKVPVK